MPSFVFLLINNPKIKIWIISGECDFSIIQTELGVSKDRILEKPVSREQLIDIVKDST